MPQTPVQEPCLTRLNKTPTYSLGRMPVPYGIGVAAVVRTCRDLDDGYLNPQNRAFIQRLCARGFSLKLLAWEERKLTSIYYQLRQRAA
jgi:hypothetical protein